MTPTNLQMIHRSRPRQIAAAGFAWLLNLQFSASGALVYAIPGSTYSQNFDGLPNAPENVSLGQSAGWTNDNSAPAPNYISIPGWYLYHPTPHQDGGDGYQSRFRVGPGSSSIGAFYSFGASGSTDRALGDLGTDTLGFAGENLYIAVRFSNSTGVTLDRFTVSFAGEQWRDGGNNTAAQSMSFSWSTDAFSIESPATLFTTVPELEFTTPDFGGSGLGTAVDGNIAGRVEFPSITISGVNWQPGEDLWLRWADLQNVGSDHALAIDDFFFSATIPEPSGITLLSISALMLGRRRRRSPDEQG